MKNLKIDKKTVSKRIHDLRKKMGFTQKYVADTLGYSTMAISKYESGKSNLSDESAVSLAKVLNVSVFELLYGDTREYTIKVIKSIKFVSTMDFYQKDGISYGHSFDELPINDKLFVTLDNLFSYIIDGYKPRFNFVKQSTMDNMSFDMDEVPKKDHSNWELAVIKFTKNSKWFDLLVRDLKAELAVPFTIRSGQSVQDHFLNKLILSINHLLFTDINYQNPNYHSIYRRLDALINKTEYNVQLDMPEGAGGSIGDSDKVANCYWEFARETQAYFKKLDGIKAKYRTLISGKDKP